MKRPETLSWNSLLGIAVLSASFFWACLGDNNVVREPTKVSTIQVDSLRFLPVGKRFITDSNAQILFQHIHAGFKCSMISPFGMNSDMHGDTLFLSPNIGAILPANENCALDSNGRDSISLFYFHDSLNSIQLRNSKGTVTDKALRVKAHSYADSFLLIKGISQQSDSSRFAFSDTAGIFPRLLRAKSLTACEALNYANYRKYGDTLKITFGWVLFDSLLVPTHCDTAISRQEFLQVLPALIIP